VIRARGRIRRRFVRAALVAASAVAVSACYHPPSVANQTLPGGKAASGPANHYTVYLHDALDLVPQSAVHNNEVRGQRGYGVYRM